MGIGGYKLQERASLTSGSWADSPAAVTSVGPNYQATVSTTAAAQFYRLVTTAQAVDTQ